MALTLETPAYNQNTNAGFFEALFLIALFGLQLCEGSQKYRISSATCSLVWDETWFNLLDRTTHHWLTTKTTVCFFVMSITSKIRYYKITISYVPSSKKFKIYQVGRIEPPGGMVLAHGSMFDTPGLNNLRHKNFKRQCPKKTMDLN